MNNLVPGCDELAPLNLFVGSLMDQNAGPTAFTEQTEKPWCEQIPMYSLIKFALERRTNHWCSSSGFNVVREALRIIPIDLWFNKELNISDSTGLLITRSVVLVRSRRSCNRN